LTRMPRKCKIILIPFHSGSSCSLSEIRLSIKPTKISLKRLVHERGAHIVWGGVQDNRVPIVLLRELIRAGRKNLTVSRGHMSFETDFLLVSRREVGC